MSSFWVLITIGVTFLIIDIIIPLKLMKFEKEGKISNKEINLKMIVILLAEFILYLGIYGFIFVDIPSYASYSAIYDYMDENHNNLDMNELDKELKKAGDDIEILSVDKIDDNNLDLKIKVNGDRGFYTNYKIRFIIKNDKIDNSFVDVVP